MDEYTKTAWAADDVITATKLNNIEDGIETVTDEVEAIEEHFDPTNQKIEFCDSDVTMTNNSTRSIVMGGYNSAGGKTYTTNVAGGEDKIIMGPAIVDSVRDIQIVGGQCFKANANHIACFPWIEEYADENGVVQSTINSGSTLSVGSCIATNQRGTNNYLHGTLNATTASGTLLFGQYNKATSNLSFALGEGLIVGYRDQLAFGLANDNKEEDTIEVGNGAYNLSAGTISRSNAFRVTKTGSAIAQTSLGIEDGNGGVVTITAAQLQALLSNASSTCLVTMTYDSTNNRYVSDKTAAEVYAAYNAAKSVVFKFSDFGYIMWGGRDHAEAFCPNVHMLYRESAAGDISDPKYIIDGYGPNDITLGMVAPTSADYFIMEIS